MFICSFRVTAKLVRLLEVTPSKPRDCEPGCDFMLKWFEMIGDKSTATIRQVLLVFGVHPLKKTWKAMVKISLQQGKERDTISIRTTKPWSFSRFYVPECINHLWRIGSMFGQYRWLDGLALKTVCITLAGSIMHYGMPAPGVSLIPSSFAQSIRVLTMV
ncbi:hypothetical protein K402DRAFT_398042 [Aulographum hederae CBS 113979]|uniref:Uncharacterized protein n=1 Tax=Aulographum hederae CBS 113979 TaxID=1176131 RepID=A0A6G1GM40_9PEZI|nr:hypothetical protein K402DRAFT_398042 [Aulographum hederae CBS 113979]